jgi:hypothetical protein
MCLTGTEKHSMPERSLAVGEYGSHSREALVPHQSFWIPPNGRDLRMLWTTDRLDISGIHPLAVTTPLSVNLWPAIA